MASVCNVSKFIANCVAKFVVYSPHQDQAGIARQNGSLFWAYFYYSRNQPLTGLFAFSIACAHKPHSSSSPIMLARLSAVSTQGRFCHGGRWRTCRACPHDNSATQSPTSSWLKPVIFCFTSDASAWSLICVTQQGANPARFCFTVQGQLYGYGEWHRQQHANRP